MIIENLSQLYPKGYLSKTIGSEATYSIPVDDQFFIVNKAFLSIKEQHLLEALFPISENLTITGNHPWFSYLFQQAKLPAEGTFRMLQIQTNVTKELQAEWQFNLTKMFPDTVDCFSPSNNMYILVEEQSKKTLIALVLYLLAIFIPLKTFSGVVSMKNNVFFQKNLIPLVGRLFLV